MALPQDGQDANGLTKVTQIPAGKELMFIDPTTNEGGIITLEDLTKQILNGLTSQTFGLDSGTQTLPAAINYLYGNTPIYQNINYRMYDNMITALNDNKDSFHNATSYILTTNLKGGAPNFVIFGKDEQGYGAGFYINYNGNINHFHIDLNEFIFLAKN